MDFVLPREGIHQPFSSFGANQKARPVMSRCNPECVPCRRPHQRAAMSQIWDEDLPNDGQSGFPPLNRKGDRRLDQARTPGGRRFRQSFFSFTGIPHVVAEPRGASRPRYP